MAKVNIKTEAEYFNHGVKANKAVSLTFKIPYSELTSSVKTLQMLNENMTVGAKLGSDKPIKLGTFMIKNLNIDNDGEGKLKVDSMIDYVELDNINQLANRSDEPLLIILKADIDVEEDDDADVEESEEP